MVVESVASARTTTTQAPPLCPLPGAVRQLKNAIALLPRFPFFLAFLFKLSFAPNSIALSYSFAFFLCLTCPALFLVSAIAVTLRLLSSTGTSPLGFYTSSAVSLRGCQVGTSSASSLCLVPEYVPAVTRTWLRASVELVQLGARDATSEVPPGQQ
ncbi:hypothetical protein PC120_g24323 [Phytophthora cactorum]|nr:hypothetical protein PC120_g24323 [Phytophthora cactorum]